MSEILAKPQFALGQSRGQFNVLFFFQILLRLILPLTSYYLLGLMERNDTNEDTGYEINYINVDLGYLNEQ